LFQLASACATSVFCRSYAPIVEKRNPLALRRAANASSSSTAAAVMWNFNLVLRSGHDLGLQDQRRDRVDPDCSLPPLVRWEYGLPRRSQAAAEALLTDAVHLPTQDFWLQERITEGSLPKPHQAVGLSPLA